MRIRVQQVGYRELQSSTEACWVVSALIYLFQAPGSLCVYHPNTSPDWFVVGEYKKPKGTLSCASGCPQRLGEAWHASDHLSLPMTAASFSVEVSTPPQGLRRIQVKQSSLNRLCPTPGSLPHCLSPAVLQTLPRLFSKVLLGVTLNWPIFIKMDET